MATQIRGRHTVNFKICLEDIRALGALHSVFDAIEQCKYAVKAKGGRVLETSFSREPDMEFNIDGNVVTVSFLIALPYECESCELKLERMVDHRFGSTVNQPIYCLVDLLVNFTKEKSANP